MNNPTFQSKCNLAGCKLKPGFIAVHIDKKTLEIDLSGYCKYHYPEAWDLEGLGLAVSVYRLLDWKLMPKRKRFEDTKICYELLEGNS